MKIAFSALLSLIAAVTVEAQCSGVPSTLTCVSTASAPTLDANLSDWTTVTGIDTKIYKIGGTVEYLGGSVSYKCLYDETNIYFALEIPGDYRFDATDNAKCASIATMMKIGSQATFYNMGGCPDALSGCPDSRTCDDYLVDLGAHWELSTTEQKVAYPFTVINDEFGMSPYCRLDDTVTGADAGNEWSGAWAHSNPVDGEAGTYTFELSRSLVTTSLLTDVQLSAGGTFQFGIAFWDPYETEQSGWSDPGHYLTGCAAEWMDLVLESGATAGTSAPNAGTVAPAGTPAATSTAAPITAAPITAAPAEATTTAPAEASTTAAPANNATTAAPGAATNATIPPANGPVTKAPSATSDTRTIFVHFVVMFSSVVAPTLFFLSY
jgi:hypothetical protein